MIRISRASNTAIIVVHEIYGINEHMRRVCQTLSGAGYDVLCPNLLERETPFDYSQEEEAYAHFMGNVGFAKAREKIKDNIMAAVEREYEKIVVVGFSVGATAAWLCSTEPQVDGVAGYYGSRIRNHLDLQPQCPTLLFFPEEEKSFRVEELIPALSAKRQVEVHRLKGRHGFGDPFSPHYHEASARVAWDRLLRFLQCEMEKHD